MISYNPKSKYSWFLYNSGQLFADITGLAENRYFSQTRNDSDTITFSISEDALNKLASALKLNAPDLLQENITEVRVLRYGTPLVAGELGPFNENLGGDRKANVNINGWLELFKSRRTSLSFAANTSALTIFQALLTQTFAKTYGTSGNYNGLNLNSYPSVDNTTVYTDPVIYDRKTLYDAFIEMTNEINGVDIEVTWDKNINLYYPHIGSVRNDIIFTYPNGNVKDIQLSIDGSKLINSLDARGNGSGASQIELPSPLIDVASGQMYGLREDVIDYSTISDITLLTNAAQADLNIYKQPVVLQKIIFDGSGRVNAPQVGTFHVGDLIKVYVNNFGLYPNISDYYIIDKIEVTIDPMDNEEVTLTVASPTLASQGI